MARTHGSGHFDVSEFAELGRNVILEPGVLVFHPEHIAIGNDVYVGHGAILKAYHRNRMTIGDGTWIGQQCFLHSAGGITIGANVGIGPGVKILTSSHRLDQIDRPILHAELEFAPVVVDEGSDIGVGAVILPGVRIGRRAQVGAGAVVTDDVPDFGIVVGVPARLVRLRE